ncbi:hypothetical protein Desaf_0909 [Desulfocurvibacter africanus subsp. africanus str. Walvis Bay]|uniref:Uncharacterized protein n=1 Tax=Desulfocurvibacter africanus subsp. africanus str. Walvis Bay TaxID=690850 RepID=F3YV07_DESAF|nr:hypothetical protein Desaf_0909 [Desulfocurvibacter africanus subsp. africanus str. Walvis Bay]
MVLPRSRSFSSDAANPFAQYCNYSRFQEAVAPNIILVLDA